MKEKIYLDQKFQNLPYKDKRKNFFVFISACKKAGIDKENFKFLVGYLLNTGRLPIDLEWKLKFEVFCNSSDIDYYWNVETEKFINKKYFTKSAFKQALKLAKQIKEVIDFYKK